MKRWVKINIDPWLKISEKYGTNTAMIYAVIYSHVNADDGYAYPSYAVIMKEANVSNKTLLKGLKALRDNGYILVAKGKKGDCNKYFFPYEALYNKDKAQELCGTATAKSIPKNAPTPAISPVITFSDDEEDLF